MKKTLLFALSAAFLFATTGVKAENKMMKGKAPALESLSGEVVKVEKDMGMGKCDSKMKKAKEMGKEAGLAPSQTVTPGMNPPPPPGKMQKVTLKTAAGERKVMLCQKEEDTTVVKAGDKLELKGFKGPGEKEGKGAPFCAIEATCNGTALKMVDMKGCPMMKDGSMMKGKCEKKAADVKEKKAKVDAKAKEVKSAVPTAVPTVQ